MTDNTETMTSLWNFLDRKLEGKIDTEGLIAVLGLIDLYAIFSSTGTHILPPTETVGPPAQPQEMRQAFNSLLDGPLGEKLPPGAKTALTEMLQPPVPAEQGPPSDSVPDRKDKTMDSLNLLTSLSSLFGGQSGPRLDPVTLLALLSLFGRRDRREARNPENPTEKKPDTSEIDSSDDAATAKPEGTADAKAATESVRVSHRSFGDRRER